MIDLKLSSISTISQAFLATSVPQPIPNPTLAFERAGASLVPSPVTATEHLLSSRPSPPW